MAIRLLLVRIGFVTGLIWMPFVGDVQALSSFSRIVAFGDSYSDSGNIGRSTEAENWVELLAEALDIGTLLPSRRGGTNFSHGTATALGSGGLDFSFQLRQYNQLNPISDPDALYVIWIGFNDIQASRNLIDPLFFADQIVGQIESGIQNILQSGGRHFLIPNAWDITTTPLSLFREPEVNQQNTEVHLRFNESLEAMRERFPETVRTLDAFGLSRAIHANPSLFGFDSGLSVCPAVASQCDGFVWRDLIHPTTVDASNPRRSGPCGHSGAEFGDPRLHRTCHPADVLTRTPNALGSAGR